MKLNLASTYGKCVNIKETTMELKDLVGFHSLTGVRRGRGLYHEDWNGAKEESEFVAFQLDGVTYLAVEDPDDGYRSYCEKLVIANSIEVTRIPDTEVFCVMKPDSRYETNDVLLILDARTRACVLEVGTENTDDYYPYCVMAWHPENLYINRRVKI